MADLTTRIVGDRARVCSQLLDRLPARGSGSVLSAYSSGFNISVGEELLYMGSTDRALSCTGAAVSARERNVLRARARPGDLVTLRDRVVRVYDRLGVTEIDLSGFEPVDLSLASIRSAAIDDEARTALIRCLDELDLATTIGIARDARLREHLHRLADPDSSSAGIARGVEFLLGRGAGLTPSGDDVLMGLGVARWLQRRETRLIDAISRSGLDRTTPVSRAYLRALIAGAANENYIDLGRAVAAAQTERFGGLIKSIRAVGHTSGSDSLLGFALGWGLDVDRLLSTKPQRTHSGCRASTSDGSIASPGAFRVVRGTRMNRMCTRSGIYHLA
ncbi:hypothetical protein Corgl_1633 [Coriobacterium glomerans PW2]|uniref:DUF2877 domain-containing protein n=1 Tax=Coriobacterium glomerans (strain ATCC 49209 / DSM 20642 / JCM 10262 / PW2) TaxID=700015 RepID=F2N956_CORGP|nr:DUF2877 domain-containing protein [Coriobacterium glomerans]AEB07732.1 hypothetical protein Corgl_1633 [Coriobacterium glomerans PW2]